MAFMKSLHHYFSRWSLGDWLVLIVLGVVTIIVDGVQPTHHEFNPNDYAINYPYYSDTVPVWLLIVLAVVFPLLVFAALFLISRNKPFARTELYHAILGFALCVVLNLLSTDAVKKATGRPRPNCIALAGWQDGAFHESQSRINEAFQSYPSGHSSLSFAGLGFLSLYLYYKLQSPFFHDLAETIKVRGALYPTNQAWKLVTVMSPIILATWIGITRIRDYWHNYDDVTCGAVIGAFWAIVIFNLHFMPYVRYWAEQSKKSDITPPDRNANTLENLIGVNEDTAVGGTSSQLPDSRRGSNDSNAVNDTARYVQPPTQQYNTRQGMIADNVPVDDPASLV